MTQAPDLRHADKLQNRSIDRRPLAVKSHAYTRANKPPHTTGEFDHREILIFWQTRRGLSAVNQNQDLVIQLEHVINRFDRKMHRKMSRNVLIRRQVVPAA